MELDLQSLIGLRNPPPPHLGSYTRALLVSHGRRHLLVTLWPQYMKPGLRIRVRLIPIRMQHFGLNTDPNSDPEFDDQKMEKKFFRTSKLQKKPSAHKREHPALQNMKFLNFFYFCCVSLKYSESAATGLNFEPPRLHSERIRPSTAQI
jgi:hypothetical protein